MSEGPLNTNEKANKLITEDFVKEALMNDKGPDAKYKAFEIIDFCSKGDNYSCFVTSVKVTYLHGREEKLVTYVVKLNQCSGFESAEKLSELSFKKEGNFYFKLLPEMNELMLSLGMLPLKFASCFFASFEPKRQVMFLSDKRKELFKMVNRFAGLDHDHAVLVLKELGRLHAASVILEDRLGTEPFSKKFEFLDEFYTMPEVSPVLRDMFVGYVTNGAKIAGRVAGYEKISAWLMEMVPTCFDTLLTQIRECDPKFRVVNHGDCWNNNFLFRYDGGMVVDVCLLDLQINRHASLALDLNFFLLTGLTGDTRKKGLKSFLRTYYNAFQEVCDAAKKPMKFTVDELEEEFRSKSDFGLVMALMIAPILVMQATDLSDMDDVNEENVKAKIDECSECILQRVDTSPILRPRMLDVLDEMVENGTIKVA